MSVKIPWWEADRVVIRITLEMGIIQQTSVELVSGENDAAGKQQNGQSKLVSELHDTLLRLHANLATKYDSNK